MRQIDADALMPLFVTKANTMKDRHGVKLGDEWLLNYNDIKDVIDNAPTVEPQKIVIIPPELIEKLALCVVDTIGNIDWDKAIEAYKARPRGEWINQSQGAKYPCECSECRTEPFCNDDGYVLSDFCPNCGAYMRKEASDV